MRLLAKNQRTARLVGGSFMTLLASAAVASAAVPPPFVAAPQLAAAPYAGYVNHAHLVPAFRWGWFGADRPQPQIGWHRDYNGDVIRWSRYRRY